MAERELIDVRIGVLGGSFNPPTKAHIALSKECIENDLCDRVIWVPTNDYYPKKTNISSKYRVEMVKRALEKEDKIDYSLHEFEVDRIVITLESMEMLQNKYPNDELYFIAGADKIVLKWMQKEAFISQFGYILVNRGDIDCKEIIESVPILKKYENKIKMLNYNSDISSTMVREEIREKGESNLIDVDVLEYIKNNKLYLN